MTIKTKHERAIEIRAIIDTEVARPFPRILEVKRALGLLGPLVQDLAFAADIEQSNMRNSTIAVLNSHSQELARLKAWAESVAPKLGDL